MQADSAEGLAQSGQRAYSPGSLGLGPATYSVAWPPAAGAMTVLRHHGQSSSSPGASAGISRVSPQTQRKVTDSAGSASMSPAGGCPVVPGQIANSPPQTLP